MPGDPAVMLGCAQAVQQAATPAVVPTGAQMVPVRGVAHQVRDDPRSWMLNVAPPTRQDATSLHPDLKLG